MTNLYIAAVADRGLVAFVQAYPDEPSAWAGIARYLREYQRYEGNEDQAAVQQWLDEHDAYLHADVVQQDAPATSALQKFLQGRTFVVLVANDDNEPDSRFEAWAYEGPLCFEKSAPIVFGLGDTPIASLHTLNEHLASPTRASES